VFSATAPFHAAFPADNGELLEKRAEQDDVVNFILESGERNQERLRSSSRPLSRHAQPPGAMRRTTAFVRRVDQSSFQARVVKFLATRPLAE
jgi:hypothetical protein